MQSIVVTGGAGFIGSHVAERIAREYPTARIDIIDKMTYAADFNNIAPILEPGLRTLHVADLCDFDICTKLTRGVDCVIHLAAESHVDNSFGNSLPFTRSNALGTHSLLEASRVNKVKRFIHISTDEVYGETREGRHTETDALNPTNPYSASKAAADMIANGYIHSFNMPIIIMRANNIFGIRQFPEKIIPKFSMLGILGKEFTIHGTGQNRRRYLAAQDFAEAIVTVLEKGELGEIYNVGSEEEYTNLQVLDMIAKALGIDAASATRFVEDRPFNDFRYAVNADKLSALGWRQTRSLGDTIGEIVAWYRENRLRYAHLFA
ncbi:GDP-mannose 4,6-dehydratase [Caulobacter hibisci]|uniref:GDP-mannose 4,6-dehydratase n=1 Tax=Caulobacter hibisci TaxID=2035993 RepID=A0ABS0SUG2_9CAUL|nr:GDP-mannose 4,6-dehydratase [Caulobacter hibisci]